MQYLEEMPSDDLGEFPSQIFFQILLPPASIEELKRNLRSAMHPAALTIELQHGILDESSPLAYGWEPDGSGKTWKNLDKANRRIRVTEASFQYYPLRPNLDENTGEALEQSATSISDIALTQSQKIQEALDSLKNETRQVRNAVLVGSLLVGAAIYLFR